MTSHHIVVRRQPAREPLRWRYAAIPVGLTLAIGMCTLVPGRAPSEAADAGDTLRSVRVARVTERQGDIGLTASGTLVPHETFAAGTDIAGAIVRRVLVEEGSFVAAGQVLAELDGASLTSQIAQQQAVVAQHRTAVRQAGAEASRALSAAADGVLSTEAIQARGFRADSAASALNVQEALLRDLRTRAGRLAIRAPVAGRVMERNVRVGDVTGAPQPMFTIVQAAMIELRVQVPENRLGEVSVGMPAAITLADGTRMDGRVAGLGTRVAQQSAQGDVRIRLMPAAGGEWPVLRPGASGTARLLGRGSAVPAVPEAAIQYDGDGSTVMTLAPGNRVRTVRVRTGARRDGYVALAEGPAVGTPVLVGSGAFVAEGDAVRPVFAEGRAAR